MKFTAKPIDQNGMSLSAYVEDVSMDKLLEKFPEGRMEGYYEPEKGYDEDELGFEDENGKQYYVYSRYGDVRVGSHDNDETPDVMALVRYLKNSCRK